MSVPERRFFQSQGLRLHYSDWGNADAPLMLLVHGGRDHSRNWDLIARSLQPHFHILAPDLRGHGDSDWTKGGSYSDPRQYLPAVGANRVREKPLRLVSPD